VTVTPESLCSKPECWCVGLRQVFDEEEVRTGLTAKVAEMNDLLVSPSPAAAPPAAPGAPAKAGLSSFLGKLHVRFFRFRGSSHPPRCCFREHFRNIICVQVVCSAGARLHPPAKARTRLDLHPRPCYHPVLRRRRKHAARHPSCM
jgi:hypothetical protein